jgi:hypothetical protein
MNADGPWPWLVFAGLGAYHGINPAMGWLFAVALGLQEKRRGAVLQALPPIALGHAASVALVVSLAAFTQLMLPHAAMRTVCAAVLIGFGLLRLLRTRHPRWVGMRVGPRDLTAWSFIMSSAHGAGLMLLPVLVACGTAGGHTAAPFHGLVTASIVPQAASTAASGFLAAAVGMHTLGLLFTAGVVALVVYEKVGLGLLRRAWVNLDLVWSAALFVSGCVIVLL